MHGLNSARAIAVAVQRKRRARLVRVLLTLQRVTMLMIRLAQAITMSIPQIAHKNVNQTRIVMRTMPVPHHQRHQTRRKTCQLGQCAQLPRLFLSPRICSRALMACYLHCSGPRDRCSYHTLHQVFPLFRLSRSRSRSRSHIRSIDVIGPSYPEWGVLTFGLN